MHSKALVASALFSSSLASIVTPSVSAADPTITPGPNIELLRKQNDARFMGWVSISGVWTSQQCELGASLYQSGGHWRCCATTAAGCDIPQACVNGNLIFDGALLGSSTSLTFPCTSVYDDPTDRSFTVCNTAFLYENEQDSSPQTNVNCGVSSVNWSYWRVQPEAAKTTAAPSITRSSTNPTLTDINDPTDADPTLVPTTPAPKKSSSKAWIAGAVVGPLLGLALIGGLIWFFLRRKKTAAAAAPPPAQTTAAAAPPQYYPPPMQQNASAAPFGVADGKQWAPQSPQSPVSSVPSPGPYGGQYPQQGGHAGPGQEFVQPVYGAPSPSMSPPPLQQQGGYAPQQQQQQAFEARPFSTELDATPPVAPKGQ
ncbi:hypothetical protein C7974DRAFT_87396 [Boeremia exigua]|uniref:uncharacterized protein n=1 Tax=Boeremia exigua TaxID=749465 RepID=UPI001E8D0881|nr:uncharacterized protein C7974DRAFT_87396 [Boeremia exigua]KAH6611919.1 hypothetical protein C7974DRAFT_87396 [Boeremia exigua]